MPALSEALCSKRGRILAAQGKDVPCKCNKMLFNYILSSLTKPDPCLIGSNCTNLVPDKLLYKLVYGYFSVISLIKTNKYFKQFFVSDTTSFISGRFTVVNERHVLAVFFWLGMP